MESDGMCTLDYMGWKVSRVCLLNMAKTLTLSSSGVPPVSLALMGWYGIGLSDGYGPLVITVCSVISLGLHKVAFAFGCGKVLFG